MQRFKLVISMRHKMRRRLGRCGRAAAM